jgi:hypothetical protein
MVCTRKIKKNIDILSIMNLFTKEGQRKSKTNIVYITEYVV